MTHGDWGSVKAVPEAKAKRASCGAPAGIRATRDDRVLAGLVGTAGPIRRVKHLVAGDGDPSGALAA